MSHYQLLRITDINDNINWRLPNIKYAHCDLMYAKINSNWYNVEDNFHWRVGIVGLDEVHPIAGQYDINSFVAMMTTAFQVQDPNFTVSYNADTNRITVSLSSGTFGMSGGPGTDLCRCMGWNYDDFPTNTGLTSYVSPNPPNLSLGDVVVNIAGLSQGQTVNSDDVNECFTMVIPCGTVNTYTVYDQINYTMKINRSAFDISIKNQYPNLSMNGINLDLMLEYKH